MISTREVVIGVYGAWRLLRFDRAALQYFDSTIDGFWKSFFAALVTLPSLLILGALFVANNPDIEAEVGIGRIAMVFAIDYAYQWVLFPVVMIYLAEVMGRSGQYVTFIVARNWSQVIQVAIVFPAAILLSMNGSNEAGWGQIIFFVALLVTWVYAWFIARVALDISGPAAAVVVFVEVAISLAFSFLSNALIRGG